MIGSHLRLHTPSHSIRLICLACTITCFIPTASIVRSFRHSKTAKAPGSQRSWWNMLTERGRASTCRVLHRVPGRIRNANLWGRNNSSPSQWNHDTYPRCSFSLRDDVFFAGPVHLRVCATRTDQRAEPASCFQPNRLPIVPDVGLRQVPWSGRQLPPAESVQL